MARVEDFPIGTKVLVPRFPKDPSPWKLTVVDHCGARLAVSDSAEGPLQLIFYRYPDEVYAVSMTVYEKGMLLQNLHDVCIGMSRRALMTSNHEWWSRLDKLYGKIMSKITKYQMEGGMTLWLDSSIGGKNT